MTVATCLAGVEPAPPVAGLAAAPVDVSRLRQDRALRVGRRSLATVRKPCLTKSRSRCIVVMDVGNGVMEEK